MTRRKILCAFVAAQGARPAAARITRITLAPVQGRFHKFVCMNAYDRAPKGHTYDNTLVRIATDQGVEGVGVMGYPPPDAAFLAAAKSLLGADPLSLYQMSAGRIVGRASAPESTLRKYKHLDGPLLDLVGKLTNTPCWKLLGGPARDRIEVYDGTLYFSDIWFKDRGVRAVVEEAEEAARSGYLGMKFKLGRGFRWMDKDAGLARDIEVVKAVRKALGPKIKILVDANNGYRDDFERGWRLLAETQEANLYWMEELFPENVQEYTRLRERMAKAGMKTLIADGESVREPGDFAPYLKPRRLIDVLQMDIRTGGFLSNLDMARMGEAVGAVSVPHNWGAQVGLFMGLHLAKAARAVPAAEDDRSTCDAVTAEGYIFRGGYYSVPDSPGLGLRVNEDVYREKYKLHETVIS